MKEATAWALGAALLLGGSAVFGRAEEDIGDVLRASVAAGDVAGVVSVVSAPDCSMRIDCAGYADVERKIPMRPDTVFALFSCSKSVCGTAVMNPD